MMTYHLRTIIPSNSLFSNEIKSMPASVILDWLYGTTGFGASSVWVKAGILKKHMKIIINAFFILSKLNRIILLKISINLNYGNLLTYTSQFHIFTLSTKIKNHEIPGVSFMDCRYTNSNHRSTGSYCILFKVWHLWCGSCSKLF